MSMLVGGESIPKLLPERIEHDCPSGIQAPMLTLACSTALVRIRLDDRSSFIVRFYRA